MNTRHKTATAAASKPALKTPASAPQDWSTKIAKAVDARRAGQKAREGKPSSFGAKSYSPR